MDPEKQKLALEISKLESEITQIRSQERRSWITSLSILVAIAVSVLGGWNTLSSIAARNEAQKLEAVVTSIKILFDDVLPKLTDTSNPGAKSAALSVSPDLMQMSPILCKGLLGAIEYSSKGGDTDADKLRNSLGANPCPR